MHQLVASYPCEHSKTTAMFSRTQNSGVLQLHVTDDGHLYSAGADGTLKVRLTTEDSSSGGGTVAAPSRLSNTIINEWTGAAAATNKTVTFSLG